MVYTIFVKTAFGLLGPLILIANVAYDEQDMKDFPNTFKKYYTGKIKKEVPSAVMQE